jgi:glucose/arabinose dehydrogenase
MLKIVKTLEAENEVVRARPVDCAQAPDGSILFSADQPGRVYRIRYVGKP